MLDINHLSYTYPDGTHALKDITFTIPQEHIFAIMGFSGSGKTTLINCLARFLIPQSGSIVLDGENVSMMEERVFRERLGIVFQRLHLFPHLTVLENMMLAPQRVQERSPKTVQSDSMEMLERLRIADLATQYPSQVSGGQAQRVAIARGLMLKPKVMLLDEPTSALDARTTQNFTDWLLELQSETTFIIVTHDLPFAEKSAPKGVFMREGKVVKAGLMCDILEHAQGS